MLIGKELVDDIASYRGKSCEIAFWWLGQMGFAIRMGELTLYIDPYLEESPERQISPLLAANDIKDADYVFGSHGHSDHLDRIAWSAIHSNSRRTKFVVPKLLVLSLSKELSIPLENIVGMDDGVVYEDGRIKVTGIASAHELLSPEPRTGLHPSLGFIIERDGCKIYHSGDTCKYDGLEKRLVEVGNIDVMFIPINGRDARRYRAGCIGNMDFREAVDLVGMVRPRLGVPAHYEMFEGNSENPMAFAEYLEAKYPERQFWIGAHGTRVVLPCRK
jgi:L-ascorbate 6-phosphate lactonase